MKWVCIGGGESLNTEDVNYCRGKAKVIVVNDGYRKAPWADVLYAGDHRWWISTPVGGEQTHERASRCVKRRLCPDTGTCEMFGLEYIPHLPGKELADAPCVTGNVSGTSAINFAANEGATTIILLGFDMQGRHWFGDHPETIEVAGRIEYMNSITDEDFQYARDELGKMALKLKARGIEVINCTRTTALRCFPQRAIEECL